jgi:hypothetical protein
MRPPLLLPCAFTIALCTATSAGAQDGAGIGDVAFLSGCWGGRTGDIEMREQWSDPSGGAMLGTTRFLRDGVVVDWEFARLAEDADGVTLWPYPSGRPSEDGFPLVRTGAELVFENLAHDFPVRIIYARQSGDRLTIRIEGTDGEGRGWSVGRVPCPGGK